MLELSVPYLRVEWLKRGNLVDMMAAVLAFSTLPSGRVVETFLFCLRCQKDCRLSVPYLRVEWLKHKHLEGSTGGLNLTFSTLPSGRVVETFPFVPGGDRADIFQYPTFGSSG